MIETLYRGNVMEDTPLPTRYLTVKELATRLRRSTRTIHQYIADGKIQTIQFTSRGARLITIDEVERFERESVKDPK